MLHMVLQELLQHKLKDVDRILRPRGWTISTVRDAINYCSAAKSNRHSIRGIYSFERTRKPPHVRYATSNNQLCYEK